MISDGIKNSRLRNILTQLCCNKRMMSDCRFFDRMLIVFLFAFNRFVCFVIVGEIEGIFARTRMSFRDFSFLYEIIGGWLKIFVA